MSDARQQRTLLTIVLAIGLTDALLLCVLVYVAFIDRDDGLVSILGPLHGGGFVLLLTLTLVGVLRDMWGWWFPALVLVTGGPLGSLIGEVVLRRRLAPTV